MFNKHLSDKASMIFISILLLSIMGLSNAMANTDLETTKRMDKEFEEDQSIKSQLKFTSRIRSIFQDSKGHYWFGSDNQGVSLFDGEKFSYFTVEEGLSDNQIRSIQEAEDGSIWFGTGHGISSYDGTQMINHSLKNLNFDFEPKYAGIMTRIIDSDELWFDAGNESAVYRLKNNTLNYLVFPVQKDNSSDNLYATTGFSKSKNGDIWISTYTAVLKYDGSHFTMIDDKSLGYLKPSLHVRSILEDSKGNLWIGNNGIGVIVKIGDKFFNFSDKQGLIHPNSSGSGSHSPQGTLEHVFAIEEDHNGNIWFGDRDTGVWKYDGKTMTNYSIKDGLSNNFAQAIYTDKNGGLWLGLGDGSVYLFNGQSFDRKFAITQE